MCGFDRLGPRSRPKREVVVGAEGPKVVLKEVPRGDGVPSAWNFSRFLSSVAKLEEERGLMVAMMGKLREQLMEEVEGFGEHLGYDGKAVESHSTGRKRGKRGKTSDPDADWGKHETRGVDGKTGKLWRKIKIWFGYRVHLIADTRYEIPVACRVRRASQSEVKQLEAMTEELFEETPATGGAMPGLQRGPRPRQRAGQGEVMGRLRHSSLDRTPGAVEAGEEGAGLRPHPRDHATAVSGPGRYHRAYRKRGKWAASALKPAGSDRWPSRALRRSGGG